MSKRALTLYDRSDFLLKVAMRVLNVQGIGQLFQEVWWDMQYRKRWTHEALDEFEREIFRLSKITEFELEDC